VGWTNKYQDYFWGHILLGNNKEIVNFMPTFLTTLYSSPMGLRATGTNFPSETRKAVVRRYATCIAVSCLLLAACGPLALAQATADFSPKSINFGYVAGGASSLPQNVTLTNNGSATLNITSITITGANFKDFSQTNDCGTQVSAGAHCTITVIFKPLGGGIRSARISVADSASGSPQLVPLSGSGLASAAIVLPASLTFPGQPVSTTSAPRSVTLTNITQTALQISSITIGGANASEFSMTHNCPSSLAGQASCTLTFMFTPAAAWARSAVLLITDNGLGSPHMAGLAGSGVSGGVPSLSSSGLTFSPQSVGTKSAPRSVTLTNTGTAPISIASVAAAGDYAQTNNCKASLAVNAFCTVTVTFSPSDGASRPGWVTFNFTDPIGLATVTLSGTGSLSPVVSVKPRAVSLTPTQTAQYTAYISGVQTTNVSWAVDGVVGGNNAVGTISTGGLYTPPTTAGSHKITAINNANTTQMAAARLTVCGYAGTITHHNDNLRTGQNNSEGALTTGNVNPNQFGKLFSQPVDGYVYAEPLWVPSVNITGKGVHNVVYVATEHDSVYAFDADQPLGGPLWHTSFINPPAGITTVPRADIEVGFDLVPEAGITATPVIDPARGVLYVVARTKEVSGSVINYVHRLHALDIASGNEMPGSPVLITGSVPGTGYDNVKGVVTFGGLRHNNRAGLLLVNGVVYVAFSSLEDINPYHGWIFGYDANTLAQVIAFNATPNGSKAGIWMGGGGLPADASGNIYVSTGTGTFDPLKGGGITFSKLLPGSGTLTVTDFFAPLNQQYLNLEKANADMSSSGPLLLPDQVGLPTHLALVCGKNGALYLMDRDNLGKFHSDGDHVVQALYGTIGSSSPIPPTGNWGTPAYFRGQIYIQGVGDFLKQFDTFQSLLSAAPLAASSTTVGYTGTTPVISSNGLQNGIVWTSEVGGSANGKPVILHAYDAANVSHELYNSSMSGKRDSAGPAVKFGVPTVANGKVYVGSQTELDVYGLLP
jgi:hypothetical protein